MVNSNIPGHNAHFGRQFDNAQPILHRYAESPIKNFIKQTYIDTHVVKSFMDLLHLDVGFKVCEKKKFWLMLKILWHNKKSGKY